MATTKEKTDNFLASDINFGRVSLTQKAIFAKHLAIMLKAGLDISEALAIVVDASTGKFKKIIKEVLKSVESGESLANALGQYPQIFSGIFINSILVGESSRYFGGKFRERRYPVRERKRTARQGNRSHALSDCGFSSCRWFRLNHCVSSFAENRSFVPRLKSQTTAVHANFDLGFYCFAKLRINYFYLFSCLASCLGLVSAAKIYPTINSLVNFTYAANWTNGARF